jgi:hypothetical protein
MLPVLWEEARDGVWTGLTDNYVRVYSHGQDIAANTVTLTRLVEPYADGLLGVAC